MITQVTATIKLFGKQYDIWDDNSRFKVVVAGRRFGKTILALVDLIAFALSHKNSLCWYVAPTFRQAKRISWELLKRIIPQEAEPKFNETELSVIFVNGAKIELLGADKEDSLRGSGVWRMVIDEFASILDNWKVWNEILRPTLVDTKGGCLFIGTPKGKDAFYELFLKGGKEKDWKSWHYTTADNPYISQEELDEIKKTCPERYWRQEYAALFEDFVGLVYPEFSQDHIIEPCFVQNVWQKRGAIDVALAGVTGALKAYIDDEGIVTVYDEFYEENVRASQVCETIKEEGIVWFIDPASQARNTVKDGKLYSLYDEYLEYGINAFPAENDVNAGINRVAEYFKQGKIRIFKTCTNLIWELGRYHWTDPKEMAGGEIRRKPFKKDDHLVDPLRYLIMSRPPSTNLDSIESINPNSAWGQMVMAMNSKKDGVYGRRNYRR